MSKQSPDLTSKHSDVTDKNASNTSRTSSKSTLPPKTDMTANLETFYVDKELWGYGSVEKHADTSSALFRGELHRAANQAYYAPFINEEFELYITRKRMIHSYANQVEVQAVAELYSRNIEVYFFNNESIKNPAIPVLGIHGFNTDRVDNVAVELNFEIKFPEKNPTQLSYHKDNHYNALSTSLRGVGCQIRKLRKVLKELAQGDVEKASGSGDDDYEDVPAASPSADSDKSYLKPSMASDTPLAKSDFTWVARGLEGHKRFLKVTAQGKSSFYSSPLRRTPSKISEATFTSGSASSSSIISEQSEELVVSTSTDAETS